MRIAFECFGEFRCALEHGHIETYMKTFPHIFNPQYGNTVDVFMLTSYHGDHDKKNRITEYVRGLFGERLKVLAFVEDLYASGGDSGHESVHKQKEDQIMERWNELSSDKILSEEEWNNYRNELSRGTDRLFSLSPKHFYFYHWKHLMELSNTGHPDHRKIHLAKDKFVPRMYYRKWLVNSLRQKYEVEQGNSGHGYDWVVLGRPFDMIYEMCKPLDFLCLPAQPGHVYASIDHFIATSPENMDAILAPFETIYPVVGYEQWLDERYCSIYRSFDQYLYYLRNDTTHCSENQILWQCVQVCGDDFVNLRISNNSTDTHIVVNPDAYLLSIYCPHRQKF